MSQNVIQFNNTFYEQTIGTANLTKKLRKVIMDCG